ncbi:MAG: sigma-70 family RNA polymerase sigma factor, partial [Planctomycetota bacterium]
MQKQADQTATVQPSEPAEAEQYAEEFVGGDQPNGHLTGQALKAYGRQMNHQKNEDDLILQYLPLVHRIVSQVASYLKPPLSREDLVSAGTIGLVKAARDFDPTKDAEFKTYAYIRVRGAVIDELRGWSFAPPAVKKLIDQARDISEHMINESGRTPSDQELAS